MQTWSLTRTEMLQHIGANKGFLFGVIFGFSFLRAAYRWHFILVTSSRSQPGGAPGGGCSKHPVSSTNVTNTPAVPFLLYFTGLNGPNLLPTASSTGCCCSQTGVHRWSHKRAVFILCVWVCIVTKWSKELSTLLLQSKSCYQCQELHLESLVTLQTVSQTLVLYRTLIVLGGVLSFSTLFILMFCVAVQIYCISCALHFSKAKSQSAENVMPASVSHGKAAASWAEAPHIMRNQNGP